MSVLLGASLRDKQIGALARILNLNRPISQPDDALNAQAEGAAAHLAAGIEDLPVWKVLVYDDLGRNVITTVLQVKDLRSFGITVHVHIKQPRTSIPDVPAVYLIAPTTENMQLISKDVSKRMYSSVYIYCLSSFPRQILEEFAGDLIRSKAQASDIAEIYDQYVNFIVNESDVFNLGIPNTFWAINSPHIPDHQREKTIDDIVSGLFSVIITMGSMPIIRCPPKTAAALVAERLDRKLRDHLLSTKDQIPFGFSANASNIPYAPTSSRPLLVLVDRTVDLVPMLSHGFTYQSLVHDILKAKLNKVKFSLPVEGSSKGETKSYEYTLMGAHDFFWSTYAGALFPKVAEQFDAEWARYKADADAVALKTGMTSIDDLSGADNSLAIAKGRQEALDAIPIIRRRKEILEMHMQIASALFRDLQTRSRNEFYDLEESIADQTPAQILAIIKDKKKSSNPTDSLRLFIIWYLSTSQDVPRAELAKFTESLKEAGADTSCIPYIRSARELTRMTMMASSISTSGPNQSSANSSSSSSSLLGGFSAISSRFAGALKESGIAMPVRTQHLDNLFSVFKSFMPQNQNFTLTKITESLMDPQNSSSKAIAMTQHYLYFDPQNPHARSTKTPAVAAAPASNSHHPNSRPQGMEPTFGQRRQGFSEAIVFVVGGGSIDEYGNLQEWVARTSGAPPPGSAVVGAGGTGAPGAALLDSNSGAAGALVSGIAGMGISSSSHAQKRRVVYGCTELYNPEDFIETELTRLGNELT